MSNNSENAFFALKMAEISNIIRDSDLETLSFVEIRFLTMLLTLHSSFAGFEEIIQLTLSDVEREEAGFVLHFRKEKSYQFVESNIGIVTIFLKCSLKVSSDTTPPSRVRI